jgi:hypothetical protein
VRLEMVQNWNGRSPLVVGSEGAGNLLLQAPNVPLPPPRPRNNDSPSASLHPVQQQ